MKSNKIILTADLLTQVGIVQQQLSQYNHTALKEGKDYIKNGRNYIYFESAVKTLKEHRR